MKAAVKKVRKKVEKIDNDKVGPFKIIASFPALRTEQINSALHWKPGVKKSISP